MQLYAKEATKDDPDPKALCCYGLLRMDRNEVLLRIVDGRPIRQVTTAFLGWLCERLAVEGKTALFLVWDTAPWHVSREVQTWIQEHNRMVKQAGGVRILACRLPTKSPWLNPMEPHWLHGKRAVVEPDRELIAQELVDQVYAYFGCAHVERLTQQVP